MNEQEEIVAGLIYKQVRTSAADTSLLVINTRVRDKSHRSTRHKPMGLGVLFKP